MTTWGLVATIKAPLRDTLGFAAWHLEAGAHRLWLYLDDADPKAGAALADHPRCRPVPTDEAWWTRNGGRPDKHQSRQSRNATRAYRRAADVDWLIHMDVDEFLVSARPIADRLEGLSRDTICARVRPMELLAGGDGTHFKAFIPPGPDRSRLAATLYPTFGRYVKGGFLSHLAGKVFLRTGHAGMKLRIHNVALGDQLNPSEVGLDDIDLAHVHARDWAKFRDAFAYRHAQGSYRADLGPAEKGGHTLHQLLNLIVTEDGEDGLRAFFDEVAADTPRLRSALAERGLLKRVELPLDSLIAKHFPWILRDW